MKNVQVRIDDETKAKVDKIFKEIGTTTNEAIKIFLKMSVNKKGFPFDLQLEGTHSLSEWLEEQMLPISEEEFMNAYMNIEGSFYQDDEFDAGVVNEVISVKGFVDNSIDEDEPRLLAQANVKIVDSSKVNVWEAADADSGDFEYVASSIGEYTNFLESKQKIAFLDEFFVFSKKVTAENRVKLFFEKIVPYLQTRDIEVIAFMNAGFWRTDAVEEQHSLDKAFRRNNISVSETNKKWQMAVQYIVLDN